MAESRKFDFTTIQLPAIRLPKLPKLPTITLPELPSITLPSLPELPKFPEIEKSRLYGAIASIIAAVFVSQQDCGWYLLYRTPWTSTDKFVPYITTNTPPPASSSFCTIDKARLSILFDYKDVDKYLLNGSRVMVTKVQYVAKYPKAPPNGAQQWYLSLAFSALHRPLAVMFDLIENKIYTSPVINRSLAETVKYVMSGGPKTTLSRKVFDADLSNREGDDLIPIAIFMAYDHEANIVNLFLCEKLPGSGSGRDLFLCSSLLKRRGNYGPYRKTIFALDHRLDGEFKQESKSESLSAWCNLYRKEDFSMMCKDSSGDIIKCIPDVDRSISVTQ